VSTHFPTLRKHVITAEAACSSCGDDTFYPHLLLKAGDDYWEALCKACMVQMIVVARTGARVTVALQSVAREVTDSPDER